MIVPSVSASRWLVLASLAAAGLGSTVVAQTGRIAGTVTDTLNRRRLAGATILIEGLKRVFETDSSGRFVADSIPPGTYQVSFRHPMLDTLAIRATPVSVVLAAGGLARVGLGVPSGRTFLRLCVARSEASSQSAVFGVVRNVLTNEPVVGAVIRLSWVAMLVDPAIGVRRVVESRADTTDAAGRYVGCGLPTGLAVTVTATAPGLGGVSAEVPLRAEEAVPFHISLVPAGATADASLTGRVLDGERRPVPGADVWVVSGSGGSPVARTDSAGRFTLGSLPPGTATVSARRIGSTPASKIVGLAAGGSTVVQLTLTQQVLVLQELTVEAKPVSRAQRAGFSERKQRGFGKFLDQDALSRLLAVDASMLFRQLPFIRLTESSGGSVLMNQSSRGFGGGGPCAMTLFVDGMETPPDAIRGLPKEQIEAVEVYNNGADVPMEYTRPSTGCGAVLVWIKR